MPRKNPMHTGPELWDPVVYTPTIKTRQPDGSILLRAGVPVVLNGDDEIDTHEAARIMGCSRDYVGRMCDEGIFHESVDWRRIGTRGNYKLKRASVLKHAGYQIEEEKR